VVTSKSNQETILDRYKEKILGRKNPKFRIYHIEESLSCGASHFEAHSSKATRVEIIHKTHTQTQHPEMWDLKAVLKDLLGWHCVG
jgi:hypothetical protein